LLEFQRHCHRFREFMHVATGQKTITFRVIHLECDSTAGLSILRLRQLSFDKTR
jgi:hypothetical protein